MHVGAELFLLGGHLRLLRPDRLDPSLTVREPPLELGHLMQEGHFRRLEVSLPQLVHFRFHPLHFLPRRGGGFLRQDGLLYCRVDLRLLRGLVRRGFICARGLSSWTLTSISMEYFNSSFMSRSLNSISASFRLRSP